MLGQREVILVGLGKFGETVSNNLVHIIDERRVQLGKIANSVILHTINFADDEVFHSTNYMNKISETVKDSSAFKNGEKFDFIFTGDFMKMLLPNMQLILLIFLISWSKLQHLN